MLTMVKKIPNSMSMSTLSPSVKMKAGFLSFLHCRTIAICWAATDNTGNSIRLNSSKHPQEPDWAKPVLFFLEGKNIHGLKSNILAIDNTGNSIRLNLSKQPQQPDWAKPVLFCFLVKNAVKPVLSNHVKQYILWLFR